MDKMIRETITFKHSGNIGDLIYSLPSILSLCIERRTNAMLYIKLNAPSSYTDEQHPVGSVMINQLMYDMAKPLIESQCHIKEVLIYEGQAVDYDLDLFRKDYKNLAAGNISQWIGVTYPELRPNLYEQSLSVKPIPNDYIIVNRTTRYNNLYFNYSILSECPNVYFVGTEDEFKRLSVHNRNIKHLIVKDFLEMAQYIAGCRLFIGGQSMAFAIAEQLKVRRILEQYYHAPNVIPQGGEYYVCHNQKQFEKALTLTHAKDYCIR